MSQAGSLSVGSQSPASADYLSTAYRLKTFTSNPRAFQLKNLGCAHTDEKKKISSCESGFTQSGWHKMRLLIYLNSIDKKNIQLFSFFLFFTSDKMFASFKLWFHSIGLVSFNGFTHLFLLKGKACRDFVLLKYKVDVSSCVSESLSSP